jgi:hypothetical protein
MNSIERRLEKLEEMAGGGEIRSFESFMAECCKIADALRQGLELDSIKTRRFSPTMRAGIVKALPDLEQVMLEALENQGWLPLEAYCSAILIYRDPDARSQYRAGRGGRA